MKFLKVEKEQYTLSIFHLTVVPESNRRISRGTILEEITA